jgi:hypothetical protein
VSIERLKSQLERLKEEAENRSGIVRVELKDGSVARFTQEDMKAAFLNLLAMLEANGTDEIPEPPPFLVAVTNSVNPEQHGFFSGVLGVVDSNGEPFVGPVPDLSERGAA